MVNFFANRINLDVIDDNILDYFLEVGWFRNGSKLFTTHFLQFNGIIYNAIWLRIKLQQYAPSKSQMQLHLKNQNFDVVYRPFELTEEKEALFQIYKSEMSFALSPSLFYLLLDNDVKTVYNTHEIAIYDNKELIGLGIYDKGNKSSAGITNIYHPAYKKSSLGKYLMMLKMQKLKADGFQYFYPGYFAPNYTLFDYKLKINPINTEYFQLKTKSWENLKKFDANDTLLVSMKQNLSKLALQLSDHGISNQIFYYPYFDVTLNPSFFAEYELQDPIFIMLKTFKDENDFILIVTFDALHDTYKLLECYILGFPVYALEGADYYDKAVFEVGDVLDQFSELTDKQINHIRSFLNNNSNDIN